MTSLTLVRQIAARPAIVFDALTTAEGMAAWWGPDAAPVVFAESDPRLGGAWRVRFRSLDGREHEAYGVYVEFDPPHRLAMTWNYADGGEPIEEGRESRIEADLRATDGGAELTFTHGQLKNAASVASHTQGWTGAFAKLVDRLNGRTTPLR